jgi:DNA polymerase-3 subunit epsilon
LVALDFETTGLDRHRDEVVSFGLVPVIEGRIDLSGAVYREVAPAVPPSPRSVTIHYLRPHDLAGAPTMSEVRHELHERLAGRFILAWSAEVEIAFLRRTFGGTDRWWQRRTIDVLRLAIAADRERGPKGSTNYQLGAVAARFGLPVERTHHALDDAFMTAELFLVMAGMRGGDCRVRTFLRASRGN